MFRYKTVKKIKEIKDGNLKYSQVVNTTIDINAGAILPKKTLLDPIWLSDIITATRQNKIAEDLVSLPVHNQINPKVIIAFGIVAVLIMAIGLPALSSQGLLDFDNPLGNLFNFGR